MKRFIAAQLLTDEAWQTALKEGFHLQHIDDTPDRYLRAVILRAMEEELAEVRQIVANPEKPTFENTVVALSRAGGLLGRASGVMYNLESAETNDALTDLVEEMAPLLADHSNRILLWPELFARVKEVYDNPPAELTEEDERLLQKTYEGFERSGATLDEAGKEQFREISRKLAQTQAKFSNHLLKETHSFVLHIENESDLDGLPAMHREAAAHEAAQRGLKGWVFTLQAPSFVPFMMYASNRALREQLYRAYHSRCLHDNEFNNEAVVKDIINLRQQKARLLGYPHFAQYALRRRMAETPEAVYSLLSQLIESYKPRAVEEVTEVETLARQMEGEDFRLMPWDFSYYSRLLKKQRFDYDPDMLRPYFELGRVKQGVFGLATKLYGITFEPDTSIPTYHPEVETYRVADADGNFLAVLYADFFPRKTKQGGAWMTNYRDEHCDLPTAQPATPANSLRPVVSINTNFTRPTDNTPSLLTLGEVETFLHEFGHALHGIFAMTHYEALSGTSVLWDFVELPSQFMENFAVEPAFLHTFARHYQTDEPLPESYIERIRQSRTFQAAYACMRQVSFGLLDMACYTLTSDFDEPLKPFEDRATEAVQLLPTIPDSSMLVQFGHIMSGGYAAGYYSYKWAEVLDADAFSLFAENGIFDRATAQSFRDNILSKGDTCSPMKLYTAFRHRQPTIDALLRRDGIAPK